MVSSVMETKSMHVDQGGDETEGLIAKNIQKIIEMEKRSTGALHWGSESGDRIARFAVSMPFIILHLIWFAAWILVNSGYPAVVEPFDPYPFTFLTFCVSLEAILLSAFVLISQNRLSRQTDERAHLDLQINLLAEQESTMTLQMVQRICKHLGVDCVDDATELTRETQPGKVARAIKRQLDH